MEKNLTYYAKNREKILERQRKYNKIYYERIKKTDRQTWEYLQYQKTYYRLKTYGLRPSDIVKKKEESKNKTNFLITFE